MGRRRFQAFGFVLAPGHRIGAVRHGVRGRKA
jgi:hypothetical protein